MADLKRSSADTADGISKKRKNGFLQPQKSTNPVKNGVSECFHKFTTSLYVSLAPCHVNNPINGIKSQHLDPMVMNYFSKANGVVLAYSNIRISEDNESTDSFNNPITLGRISDSSPFVFLWINVDFLIWKPQVGDVIEGYSYMQTASHIGLLIHDTFNASIKKFNIPQDWQFIPNQEDEYEEAQTETSEDEPKKFKSFGYWVDENEVKVEGKLKFTIKSIHSTGRVVSVEGTLLKPGSERDAQPIFRERRLSVQVAPGSESAAGKHKKFDDEEEDDVKETAVPKYEDSDDDKEEDGEVLNKTSDSEDSD